MQWLKNITRRILDLLGLGGRELAAILALAYGCELVRGVVNHTRYFNDEFFWGVLFATWAGFILVKALISLATQASNEKGRALLVALFPLAFVVGLGLGVVPAISYARQIDTIRDEVSAVEAAASELETEVARFDSENWRAVVSDVEIATQNLTFAVSDLQSAVD